jgi:peptidoglycan biosynthesis protein MviN/MurJ (putative lipid II flippase)
MLHLALLCNALRKKMGAFGWRRIARSTACSCLSTAVMGLSVWYLARWLIPAGGGGTLELLMDLTICMTAGMAVFVMTAAAVKAPELDTLKQLLMQRTQSK